MTLSARPKTVGKCHLTVTQSDPGDLFCCFVVFWCFCFVLVLFCPWNSYISGSNECHCQNKKETMFIYPTQLSPEVRDILFADAAVHAAIHYESGHIRNHQNQKQFKILHLQ